MTSTPSPDDGGKAPVVAGTEPVRKPTIDVQSVVDSFSDLETMAPVALRILELADQPDVSIAELAEVIATDPALSARLLRLVNGAAYSRGAEITSLERAAMVLGLRTLKLVSLGFTLVASVQDQGIDTDLIWRRSLATAVIARRVASISHVASQASPSDPEGRDLRDSAYVAGLLSNIGKIALAKSPDFIELTKRFGVMAPPEIELRYLGITSDLVTARILKAWHLPPIFFHAVASRHDPFDSARKTFCGSVIQLADAAATLVSADSGPDKALAYDSATARAVSLGLTVGEVEDLIDQSAEEIDEVLSGFSLRPFSLEEGEEIVRAAQGHLARLSLDVAMLLTDERRRSEVLFDATRQLADAASTDELTGLPNRRAFNIFMANQITVRQVEPEAAQHLGLLLIDLDHFKQINDKHGHQVGDEVLQGVARRLMDGCRRGELIARIGGEELGLIMPRVEPDEVSAAAERLRALVADEPYICSIGVVHVTTSIGGAYTRDLDDDCGQRLRQVADAQLYAAKDAGRNRCMVAASL